MGIKKIRHRQPSDTLYTIKCIEELQDYLVTVDQMEITRRMPNYAAHFTQKLLENMSRNNGVIYVAEREAQVMEFNIGIICTKSVEELFECEPLKSGRLLELFVDPSFREQNVGTTLMERMEEHFEQNGCDVSRVGIFEPNIKFYQFYMNLGCQDRMIDLIKQL